MDYLFKIEHAFYRQFWEKTFDIVLITQFCPRNFAKTRVFIFEQIANNISCVVCSKIKTRVLPTFLDKIIFWQVSFCVFS